MTSVQASKPTTGTGVFKATDKLSDVRKRGTKSYAAQVNDQQGKTKHVTLAIDWIPPKKNVGKITLFCMRCRELWERLRLYEQSDSESEITLGWGGSNMSALNSSKSEQLPRFLLHPQPRPVLLRAG